MRYSLTRHLEQIATDRWARRGMRTLLRTAWLSACVWCIGFGGHLLWGWPLRYDILSVAALGILGIGVLLLLRTRMPAIDVARRLDQRFQLNEQLATAVEVSALSPPRDSLGARLLDESARTAGRLRQQILRNQPTPWSEVLSIVALALVILGLYLLANIAGFDRQAQGLGPLPELARPQDPAEQFPPEPPPAGQQALVPGQGAGEQATAAVADPRVLGAIADALRDQGATRPAAEALDRGDTAGAAQSLRELADQAGQLSRESRANLANQLDQAAREIARRDPSVAGQLRASADGLDRGDQSAGAALDDLARAIEQLQPGQQAADQQPGQNEQGGQNQQPGQNQGDQSGQNQQPGQGDAAGGQSQADPQGTGPGQGDGAGSGAGNAPGEQRQSPHSRMGVEGKPLELDARGAGQQTRSPNRPTTSVGAGGGTTQGGAASGSDGGPIGADPLRVPLEDRDVVQEYFSK
jgi:hypothetical protein